MNSLLLIVLLELMRKRILINFSSFQTHKQIIIIIIYLF